VLSVALPNAARDAQRENLLPVRAALVVWRQLIWPCRRVWAGMAALWLVMIAINVLTLDEPLARKKASRTPMVDFWAFLAERERLLVEMGEAAPPPRPPQPAAASRPRSEYRVANRAPC